MQELKMEGGQKQDLPPSSRDIRNLQGGVIWCSSA